MPALLMSRFFINHLNTFPQERNTEFEEFIPSLKSNLFTKLIVTKLKSTTNY